MVYPCLKTNTAPTFKPYPTWLVLSTMCFGYFTFLREFYGPLVPDDFLASGSSRGSRRSKRWHKYCYQNEWPRRNCPRHEDWCILMHDNDRFCPASVSLACARQCPSAHHLETCTCRRQIYSFSTALTVFLFPPHRRLTHPSYSSYVSNSIRFFILFQFPVHLLCCRESI